MLLICSSHYLVPVATGVVGALVFAAAIASVIIVMVIMKRRKGKLSLLSQAYLHNDAEIRRYTCSSLIYFLINMQCQLLKLSHLFFDGIGGIMMSLVSNVSFYRFQEASPDVFRDGYTPYRHQLCCCEQHW